MASSSLQENDDILKPRFAKDQAEILEDRLARLEGELAGAKARAAESDEKVKAMGNTLLQASGEIQHLRQLLQAEQHRAYRAEVGVDMFASALEKSGAGKYQLQQEINMLRSQLPSQAHP